MICLVCILPSLDVYIEGMYPFFAYANAIRDTFSAAILSMNRWHLPILSTANSLRKRLLSNETIKLADGTIGQAAVTHNNNNSLTITFGADTSGTAYMN